MVYRVTNEEADLDAALRRLWGPVLPAGWNADRKFRWFYQSNPTEPGKVMLLVCDGRVGRTNDFVGCAGIGARIVHVNGEPLRAALLTDLSDALADFRIEDFVFLCHRL